jgi:hypothetical protein
MEMRYTPLPESMKGKAEHQEWLDFGLVVHGGLRASSAAR